MQNKANGIKYRSFRTGDGDRDRGTLNLMVSVGRGVRSVVQDATKSRTVTDPECQTTCVQFPTDGNVA
jgi:hypothetical protein